MLKVQDCLCETDSIYCCTLCTESHSEASDQELEWEEQQIRKGVSIPAQPVSTGWGAKKIWTCLSIITQQWLVLERRVIRQKLQNAVRNKRQIWIVKHLSILCLLCINILTLEILPNLTRNTWILNGYLSFYNLAMFTDGKARNMSKVSKLCT